MSDKVSLQAMADEALNAALGIEAQAKMLKDRAKGASFQISELELARMATRASVMRKIHQTLSLFAAHEAAIRALLQQERSRA